MYRKFKNNSVTTLAAPLAELDTTLTVPGTHGDKFPAVAAPDYFTLTLRDGSGNTEVVKVTARVGGQDFMTVERGQEGTSPLNWLIGAVVSMRLTAGAIAGMATQADPETLTNKTMGTGCAWNGTEISVAKGGTGATNASDARANLNAQTADAALDSLSALATAPNHVVVTTGTDTYGALAYGATGADLLGDTTPTEARATLGLGPLAIENVTLTAYTRQLNVVADAAAGRALLAAAAESSWQTVWIPSGAMTPRMTEGATHYAYQLPNGLVMKALAFAAAVERFAQFTVRMPKGWNEGQVKARFVWSHSGGSAFNTVWEIQGLATPDGANLAAAFGGSQLVGDVGGNTDHAYQSDETPQVTIGGTVGENSLVTFQVSRDGTNGWDNLNTDARLHGVVLMYQTASLNDA
jgi:hypothetical protein